MSISKYLKYTIGALFTIVMMITPEQMEAQRMRHGGGGG